MEALYDENLLPRVVMTFIALALALGPAAADFNKTHATNPLWPPHARFHVVWQVFTNSSLSLFMLYIIWTPIVQQYDLQLKLVAIVQSAILLPIYATMACMRLFDGALKDPNGLRPYKFDIGGKIVEVDTNVFNFTIALALLAIAYINIVSSVPAP